MSQKSSTVKSKGLVGEKQTNPSKDKETIKKLRVENRRLQAQLKQMVIPASEEITQHKQAQEKLLETMESYQLISEYAADVIWVLNPETAQFTYVSPSVEKLRGYTSEEVMAQPVTESLTPESLKLVNDALARRLPMFVAKGKGTQSFTDQVDQPCKDGSIVNTEVTTTYVFNAQGQVEIIGVTRDTTDRKQAQETLRLSEQRFRSLFENLADGLAYCQMLYRDGKPDDFIYLEANRALEEITGLHNVVGKRITELIPDVKEAAPELLPTYARVAETGISERFEINFRPLKMWLVVSVSSPQKGYFLTVFKNITERKLGEAALKESETRYHLLFDNMIEGFSLNEVITDENDHPLDFRILDANSAYEHNAGLKPNEIIGKTIREIMPQVDARQIEAYGKVALTGQSLTFDYYSKTFNRYFLVHAFCPQPKRFATIFEDITERKQAEAALQESEQRFRSLVEQSIDGVVLIDEQGTIIEWNAAEERTTGIPRSQAIGAPFWEIQYRILLPERREKLNPEYLKKNFFESLVNGKADQLGKPLDVEILSVTGEHKFIQQTSFIIHTEKGNRLGAVVRDTSDRKMAEASLHKSEERNRAMINAVPDLLFEIDRDGNILDYSAPDESTVNVPPETFLGKKTKDLLPQDVAQKGLEKIHEALKSKKLTMLEYDLLTPSGRRFFEIRNVALTENSALCVSRDITERKQAEAEREQYFRFFQTSIDIMVIADPNGAFLKVNPACLETLGYSETELVSRPFIEFIHPDDKQPTLDEMERQQQIGSSLNFENRYLCKDGSYHWLSWRAQYDQVEGVTYATARDVTSQLKTERALRESEERFRSLFEYASIGVLLADPQGTVVEVNPTALQILGSPSVEETRKINILAFQPLVEAGISSDFQKCIQTAQPLASERSYNTKWGKSLDLSLRFAPLLESSSAPNLIYILVEDITERKKADESVRRANLYNRSLLEASIDPLVTIGHDGRITDVNVATENVTGCGRDELIGNNFSNYFTEPEKAEAGYQQVFEQGAVHDFPLEIRHQDGHITSVLYNASVYHDDRGQVVGVFAAAHDITERKKAEEAAHQASLYNRNLIEASLDPLVTIGPDGKITDVNTSTEIITGCKREALVGTDFSDYFTEPDKARDGYLKVFHNGSVLNYPLKIQNLNGSVTPVLYNATVYRNEEQQVIGVFAAARDITEQLCAQEKLLATLNEKETLLREVHHRVKNNLQAMIALMEMQGRVVTDETIIQFLQELQGQARTMSLVYEQLYQSENLARVDMNQYVQKLAANTLEVFGKNRAVDLKLAVSGELDVSEAMPCGLIINELITNVLKHAFPPDFKGRPSLKIDLHQKEATWYLTVHDNGIGLPPNYDWQSARTLGLRLVNLWATHQLGGTLDVAVKQGTTFAITFDLQPQRNS